MRDFEVVGKRIPDVDASAKGTGQIQYVDDFKLPGMLYGKILASPLPHARILHVDSSRAKALPGVKAVLTGKDIPDIIFGDYIGGELGRGDHHALALEKVRHVGDAVAAVAAIDEERAQEALELIKVEYEPLPAIFDPLEAMRQGAPLIHEKLGSNICDEVTRSFGDIERGFAESDYIREDTYHTMANNHAAIEPHGILSLWKADGTITIWCSTQRPFILRTIVSSALGLPENKIRVIQPAIGGGFGGKLLANSFHMIAPILSRITGMPVKITLGREEVFVSTNHRHPMIITVRSGVKKDGTLVSQRIKVIADCGAYRGIGPVVLFNNATNRLMLPYKMSHYHYEGCRVLTNKTEASPMRGHGAPQHRFAVESQLDMIAKDLGVDPIELRLKNLVYPGYNHPFKLQVSSCGLKEAIEKVGGAFSWGERKGKLPEGRGLGLACSVFSCYPRPVARTAGSLVIEINIDGGVNILSGATDIGQGAKTVISQIVAEELGVRMEDVQITNADTAITPFDVGTFASGVTFRVGNAAILAARELKKKILEVVAPQLEARIEEVECRGGKIFVRGHEEKGITFAQAVRIYRFAGKPTPLVGHGFYTPEADKGAVLTEKQLEFSPAFAFIAQGAEVEVDRETGEIKVIRVVTADDCGQMINPLNVEGQIDGSVAGGLGMAIYEDLPHREGNYLNSSLLDYLVPTSLDMPSKMYSIPVDCWEPLGPYGAKEAGEGVLVPTTPAIANAIFNACGVRIKDLPITPDKIKKAMEAKRRI